ncbi:MAG: hypothetical protein KF696_07295 [Planctomycetes bacterium]|nr:hypothetical protein [Planctomycetota bacterium]MCW8135355.1 hypothetical protein [Planctomycetota bacterium]
MFKRAAFLLCAGVVLAAAATTTSGQDGEDDPKVVEAKAAPGYAHRLARGKGVPHQTRINAALNWLKDHQHKDGHWSSQTFSADSKREKAAKTYNLEFRAAGSDKGDRGWEESVDVGLTGLALMAFTGAGHDHARESDYRQCVRMGLMALRKVQSNDGCIGPKDDDHFVYNHAIATIAVAEIYGLTSDAVLKPMVEKAIEFTLKAQNPGMGWRYGVKPGNNDSSITGWMVMALNAARLAGLEVDTEQAFDGAAKWFKAATTETKGKYKTGYDTAGSNNARLRNTTDYSHNPAMSAIYIKSMLIMGKADLKDAAVKSLAAACVEKEMLPVWSHYKIDYYYWHFASMALYEVGGANWASWEKAMSKVLLDNQRGWHATDVKNKHTTAEALDEHGSWDAVDPWGQAGGRVYATAINCLTLQTYSRYQRTSK